MIELEPCPFCGSTIPDFHYDFDSEPIGVICRECGTVIRYLHLKRTKKGEKFGRVMQDIADRWNRREGETDERIKTIES